MSDVWTEVSCVHPRARAFRVVCAEPGCGLNSTPVTFVSRDTAESWARYHADDVRHVVLIQEAGE